MKKLFAVIIITLVFTVNAFAADTMVWTATGDGASVQIKGVCTAAADGTFTPRAIESTDVGFAYWNSNYYLYEVWAVNPASTYATTAAAVTIADASGLDILKTGELALSTSASTVTEATLAKYRAVNSKLTVTIGDTGSASNIVTLYLKLAK